MFKVLNYWRIALEKFYTIVPKPTQVLRFRRLRP